MNETRQEGERGTELLTAECRRLAEAVTPSLVIGAVRPPADEDYYVVPITIDGRQEEWPFPLELVEDLGGCDPGQVLGRLRALIRSYLRRRR